MRLIALDCDEDGIWVVEWFSIPRCVSQGRTKQEALETIKKKFVNAFGS
ncbi:type II toxin-antitoxin system HicB family antitoxin [Myxacorys almedinensis A]|uniref:Type II toxin-antitoxin system HicB family antitoxin n=1 Tax=Myxacorys almedinensis A TaxID=2690445 RepID=A0A8J7Z7H9_9CYAN|nr:type II toxin-antitoxin system HicB family antitoxin [Myxacorys almedinensis A]